MHDDGTSLEGIERELTDDVPALAEAFRKWETPAEVHEAPAGATTVPPWALAVFATAAVSWVVSPGFGVLVAAFSLLSALLNGQGGQPGQHPRTPSGEGPAPTARTEGGAPGNEGEWPPHTWRNGWM